MKTHIIRFVEGWVTEVDCMKAQVWVFLPMLCNVEHLKKAVAWCLI